MSLFSASYTDDAIYREYGEMDDFGNTHRGSDLAFKCRFEPLLKEVIDTKGNRVLSTGRIFTDLNAAPLSEIECNGATYTAITCQPIKDIMGKIDHYEVMV